MERLREWLRDPSGIKKCSTNLTNHVKEIKRNITDFRAEASKTFEQVIQEYRTYAEEQEKAAKFYHLSLNSIGDVLPDMIWMKDSSTGNYMYANKAIRDELLFDDRPLGKNDIHLGLAAVNKFGHERHNFGSYCAGSDEVTIKEGHRKRFIEYGMSGGKPLVLEVFKNVVRNEYGDIIATVGCGRDITDNIFTMLKLEESIPDDSVRENDRIVKEYLDKYLYENDTIDVTLRDFYHKFKDVYYEQLEY